MLMNSLQTPYSWSTLMTGWLPSALVVRSSHVCSACSRRTRTSGKQLLMTVLMVRSQSLLFGFSDLLLTGFSGTFIPLDKKIPYAEARTWEKMNDEKKDAYADNFAKRPEAEAKALTKKD